MKGRKPTRDEIERKQEDIFLTEQSLKELKRGLTIFEDGGRIWIHPPRKILKKVV